MILHSLRGAPRSLRTPVAARRRLTLGTTVCIARPQAGLRGDAAALPGPPSRAFGRGLPTPFAENRRVACVCVEPRVVPDQGQTDKA
jgi:hypothetical protein